MRSYFSFAASVVLAACAGSTGGSTISSYTALDAVDKSASDTQASNLASASLDVGTKFTLGSAASDAVQSITSFIETQMPCASVMVAGDALTINYGANAGNCVYDGMQLSGQQTISVVSVAESSVEVDTTWSKLSNGTVQIDGNAQLTWTSSNGSRHLTSSLTWTRLQDGASSQGSADLTQTSLDGDFATGVEESGTRSWTDGEGHWSLTIQDVQQRWIDPVPQAGSFAMVTATDANVAVTFSRVNETTIAAAVTSGSSSFTFDVAANGAITSM
jgi:hypothetical protein